MVTILWDLIQGSDEWLELRKGKITGTSAWKLLAGQNPKDIIRESSQESNFSGNKYTERGHILEKECRDLYADLTQVEVKEAGAILNDKYPNCMTSPDGLISEDGGLEIKSFLAEHMNDVWENLDSHIIAQVQWNLFISERAYWDLCLYNPELPPEEAFKVRRFTPDKEIFNKFKEALFLVEDACVEETALTLIKLEQELQTQDEQLKAQLEIRNALNQQIANIKNYLKTTTQGRVSKKVIMGDDILSLNINDRVSIEVDDESKIAEEYTNKVEVEGAFISNGKVFKRVPNTKLVQNLVKTGKSLPDGFKKKTSRSISIKFNGEPI